MLFIRPIQNEDFQALLQMSVESGVGFTSLPVDEPLLREKISHSIKSFASDAQSAGDQSYLMVAEDSETGEVVGTTAIDASVGLATPFYTYHLGKVVHASKSLNVYNVVDTLTLGNDYTGVSELCTLFLRESHRAGFNGRLLSKTRFLFMAQNQHRFDDIVIAEMRGVSDEQGRSPFWEWLQEHFFSVDFPTADYLTGVGRKEFIAELMPKYPIYVSLLSKEAQAVIGEVHEKTRPALRLLEAEGFDKHGYVDIFDAGPTVQSSFSRIKSIRNSRLYKVSIADVVNGEDLLLSNTKVEDFRACCAKVVTDEFEQTVTIDATTASVLLVAQGDELRCGALRHDEHE